MKNAWRFSVATKHPLPSIKPEESIMLFHVKMTVNLPVDMNPEAAAD
jgi:hypothetical protein